MQAKNEKEFFILVKNSRHTILHTSRKYSANKSFTENIVQRILNVGINYVMNHNIYIDSHM